MTPLKVKLETLLSDHPEARMPFLVRELGVTRQRVYQLLRELGYRRHSTWVKA